MAIGGGDVEQHVDMLAERPEAVGVANVELHHLDLGKSCEGGAGPAIIERAYSRPDAISSLGEGVHETAADMAIRSCDKSFHSQRPDYRLRPRSRH